ARSPDSESALARTDARLGDLGAHPRRLAGDAADPAGFALSRAPPPRAARLDSRRVGRVGQQPQSEVLRADESRTETARDRSRRLGTPHRGRRARLANGLTTVAKEVPMIRELWSDLRFRLRALFRRADVERELDDELRFHIEREADKLERGGM